MKFNSKFYNKNILFLIKYLLLVFYNIYSNARLCSFFALLLKVDVKSITHKDFLRSLAFEFFFIFKLIEEHHFF